VWNLWKFRNNVILRDKTFEVDEVFTLVQVKTWNWILKRNAKAKFMFSDWCFNQTLCLKSII